MTTKTLKVIVCVILVLFIALALKDCGLSEKYRNLRLQYEGYRAIAEADHEMKMKIISEAERLIAERDIRIAELEHSSAQYVEKIQSLTAKLTDLQNAEPEYPELESHPLVINLRLQIAVITDMFDLSQRTVQYKEEIIQAWEVKYNAQVTISESWASQYESEHKLRLMSEGLVTTLERDYRRVRLSGKIKNVAIVAVGGYLAYRLAKDVIK